MPDKPFPSEHEAFPAYADLGDLMQRLELPGMGEEYPHLLFDDDEFSPELWILDYHHLSSSVRSRIREQLKRQKSEIVDLTAQLD